MYTEKGGSGKTTTSQMLASGLARAGARVLLVDADQQCNLSQFNKQVSGGGVAARRPIVDAALDGGTEDDEDMQARSMADLKAHQMAAAEDEEKEKAKASDGLLMAVEPLNALGECACAPACAPMRMF